MGYFAYLCGGIGLSCQELPTSYQTLNKKYKGVTYFYFLHKEVKTLEI